MKSNDKSFHVFFWFLILLVFGHPLEGKEKELPFVVIIPSYNNVKWYDENLKTILEQDYTNFRIIYLNDCSKDGTQEAVQNYLKTHVHDYRVIDYDDCFSEDITAVTNHFVHLINQERHFFVLINNKNRCGALANLYRSIHSCRNDEIVVTVDGDDFLHHKNVLKELNTVYSSGNVWLTHGCLMEWPSKTTGWSIPVPKDIIKKNKFREFRCPSHLRTFYSWLFKKIKLEDLLYEGKFFPMTWDMAMMYPMSEMAGERQAFISKVNYRYNMANPINDNKVNAQLQRDLDYMIRHKKKYHRLGKAPKGVR